MASKPRKSTIRRRRIIERPRLLRALDRSGARVRMLVAGSGYGKTILLEQWASRDARRVGWFRPGRSAGDVAVVARGLVKAAAAIVPDAGARLLERLSTTQDPEREAVLLAEMLAEDLTLWPDDGWIVVDDYQHIAQSQQSEAFVETLVNCAPVNFMLASRSRPTWVRPRSILDGSVLELPQTALAMTNDEVEEMLAGARAELAAGIVALAEGWPAVVGLAAMAPEPGYHDALAPETLYELFADELYRGLDPDLRTGLAVLAAMPLVDHELAETILGRERANRVVDEALAFGIMDERGGRLEFHPLAETFFGRRGQREASPALRDAAAGALVAYRERRDWDPAFEIVRRFEIDSEIANLLLEGIDDTLNSGRLPVLREWTRHAKARRISHPVVSLAEVELELRRGQYVTALTLARAALENQEPSRELRYRLTAAAARAAHTASHEEEALAFYRDSLDLASTREERREARYGELMCTSALERPEAHELLRKLERSALPSDIRDQVRLTDRQLSLGFRFGCVSHLERSSAVAQLVDRVDDPFVRCSFRTQHGWAQALGAEYEEAFRTTKGLMQDASECRIDPVLPYAHAVEAVALAGLHRFAEARAAIELGSESARRFNDANGVLNAYAIRVRIMIQEGDVATACAIEPPPRTSESLASTVGEALSSRALALGCLGRLAEAIELVERAASITRGVETRALRHAVQAVCALKAGSADVVERCEELVRQARLLGAPDLAVTAYRAVPGLLTILFASDQRDETMFLVQRARDHELLAALGMSEATVLDPAAVLSKREREVYELVCAGLSNADIAQRLFIAESTVKAHVHRLFDKLGVRSRTALALDSARRGDLRGAG